MNLDSSASAWGGDSRRAFLKKTAVATVALANANLMTQAATRKYGDDAANTPVSWYRRVTRWGQTNITEIDPQQYDVGWWRQHWERTRTQGVVINAGGIVAYYPSRIPLHRQAQYLGGRDLFGELCRAAHDAGLAVFARMDSNRAHEDSYRAHPDWFAIDAAGNPHKAGELFVACINSPYYEEHIPAIMREIVEQYHPEGFTDNSWSGLGRGTPCFCEHCQKRFRDRTGQAIPRDHNWNDPIYRQWIQWNYARRLEIWDLNNQVTKAAGGPDCLWVGMNSGSISGQCQSFRDYKEICRRSEMIMLDHQSRSDSTGFQNNGEIGKLIHGLLGWDKLIPESMAMYQAGKPTFRLASKPEPEARLWMIEGIASGLQPWWHHVGAYHEDRRMYRTAESLYRWHEANEQFLINRVPVATVGLVWSQSNIDFYGRDDADTLVELPWRGMSQALLRARIPYLPVHADQIERDAAGFSLLVLPNLAAMSDEQVGSVRRFVERGGGLVGTGQTSRFTREGDPLPDYALGDLFGAHLTDTRRDSDEAIRHRWAADTYHTYLRLAPELRARMDGPHFHRRADGPAGMSSSPSAVDQPQLSAEPPISGTRHIVLRGFEETDILPFGGMLEPLTVARGAEVLATFVPPFPIYPPETAWMRQPKTEIPGLILNTTAQNGRVAFVPADLDRRFGRDNLPDHGNLLANLIRWAAKDDLPLQTEGAGLIDCHLYQQPGRLILHLVNLSNAGTWRQPVDELIPVGPLRVRVKLPKGVRGQSVRLLVSKQKTPCLTANGWSRFELKSILDHEVVVLT